MSSADTGTIMQKLLASVKRYPVRLTREEFYPIAYRFMVYSRTMDELFIELFKKRHVRGTVILTHGNEATTVGMGLPFRPGADVVGLLHRDIGAHLAQGCDPLSIFCQYMANAGSPTHGREGNVHFGDIAMRRFPMISHLGNMISTVVGGVYAARLAKEDVFGITIAGDGATSTGDFHESLNLASVRSVPVLFLIENNHYAYSTPTKYQYHCKHLSDRAAGYGIAGKTIDGTDVWEVYNAVCDALDWMSHNQLPYLLESMTLRLRGHAAYDTAEYVSESEKTLWLEREPLARARKQMLECCCWTEAQLGDVQEQTTAEVAALAQKALSYGPPDHTNPAWEVFAPRVAQTVKTFSAKKVKNFTAVNLALDAILADNPLAILAGQDIGVYGSAFKTCKGLLDKYGENRVMDLPICESASIGFSLGASQIGVRPIFEFQFADFSTEACTQIGMNASTWFFRSGSPAPILMRMPSGGGLTLGAFHSGEFDGLWSRFAGIKLLYPYTAQETFEAILAGFYDPNPCIVFEHKRLYVSSSGDIDFDGNLENIWRCRNYATGTDITIVCIGGAATETLAAVRATKASADVWNPFVLSPLKLDPIIDSLHKTGRLLVVQEAAQTSGMGDRILSVLTRACFSSLKAAPQIISAPDVPVVFAPELEKHYIPNCHSIQSSIESLIGVHP